jgi:photosystem I reaction center subunit VIII
MIPNYFPPILVPIFCLVVPFILMSSFFIYIEKDSLE